MMLIVYIQDAELEQAQRDERGLWLKGTTPPGERPFKKGQSGNPTGKPKGAKDRKNRLRDAIAAQEHLQGVLSTPEGAAGAPTARPAPPLAVLERL